MTALLLTWLWLTAAHAGTPTLAVLPFDNHTGDEQYDALGVGIADMLTTDLSHVAGLQLVERSRLADVLEELKLTESDFIDPKTAAKAGNGVGAKWILVGSISAIEPQMRLDARIVDVRSGKLVDAVSAEGTRAEFFLVEKDLALALTEELGVSVSAREAAKVGRVSTESFAAFKAWSEGLEALDQGAIADAERRFERALSHDSGFGDATARLTELEGTLKAAQVIREKAMDAEAKRLFVAFDAYAADPVDDEALIAAVKDLRGAQTLAASERMLLGRKLLNLELDESVRTGTGQWDVSINEVGMWTVFRAADELRERAAILSWGQAFVERYPQSPQFNQVRQSLDRLIELIKKEERARTADVEENRRLQRREQVLDSHCTDEPDLRRVVEPCNAWATFLRDHPGVEARDHDLYVISLRYKATGHSAGYGNLIAVATDRGWEVDDLVRARDETLPKQLEAAQRASDRLKDIDAEGYRPYTARSDLGLLRKGGRFDEADRALEQMIRKWPEHRYTWHARKDHLRAFGDTDALEKLLAEMLASETKGDDAKRYVEEAIKDVREDREDVEEALADALEDYAGDLRSAGLLGAAARAQEKLWREHPSFRKPPELLLRAADRWARVYEAGAPARARALYEELLRDYPDSDQAERARRGLSGQAR